MSVQGKRIVLAASNSESNEYLQSQWRQMLLATLPNKYSGMFGAKWSTTNDVAPDGQATYVPNGLRVVEALLLQRFAKDEIVVCYPEQMGDFIGEATRVVGIHAHNPLGITFATDVYSGFYGHDCEPINAAEFRKVILHPALLKHKHHLKTIVGGPGSWQIDHKGLQDEWKIDCIVDGEAEDVVLDLFTAADKGETLPRKIECHSPKLENIPTIHLRPSRNPLRTRE